MNTDTLTATLTAAGMNDEQTECDACGRMELRGTVIVVNEDGEEHGRYGTTCASRILGVKVTRNDAVKIEAGRRQAVVNTLRQAIAAEDDAARAWWLNEITKFYVMHRADERRVYAEQRNMLPAHWSCIVREVA